MGDPQVSSKPGWYSTTDAEQDGKEIGAALHSFYAELVRRTPKMPDEMIEDLTHQYLAGMTGLIPDIPEEFEEQ